MAVQGTLWLAKCLSLNLNFSFLNWILLLLISSSYPIVFCIIPMRGIQKETSQRPRNRNQYLYVRSISPGCCTTATQGGEWLSALWTSSACTAWRRPRWIVCPSEPFLGNQKWCNHREKGLDCMEGDRKPLTWISARVLWLCWQYETLHYCWVEWPHGWACLVVSIWSLGEG